MTLHTLRNKISDGLYSLKDPLLDTGEMLLKILIPTFKVVVCILGIALSIAFFLLRVALVVVVGIMGVSVAKSVLTPKALPGKNIFHTVRKW